MQISHMFILLFLLEITMCSNI